MCRQGCQHGIRLVHGPHLFIRSRVSISTIEYLLLALALLYPILAFIHDRIDRKAPIRHLLKLVMHTGIGYAETYLRRLRNRLRAKK